MLLIQYFLLVFFAVALYRVLVRTKRGELGLAASLVWALLWVAAGVVVVLPNSTSYVAKLFGVGRGADIVVYAGLAVLFFLMFRLSVKIENLNREITKVVREKSLRELE